ncbi:DNA-binding domain-containing protein [Paucibacter soli]|uniref:DNA-binding domain-containing protein n=1 Tax=Paucibacter soli TaxID=3133433 RepID=UPI0030AA60EF
MNLQAQQQAFQRAVLGQALVPQLLGQGSEKRLAVYAHAYRARLLGALRDNYEVLALAMGDAAFDALGHAYIEAYPSRQASIRWFGDALADFMDGPYAARLPHAALRDLARMDWALRGAFDAAAAAPMTLAQLQTLAPAAWAGLALRLQPSVRLLALDWVVEPVWRALRQHQPGAAEPELPEPLAQGHGLLVWRQGLETRWRSLAAEEQALLQGLGEGATFAHLCELASALHGPEQAAEQVAAVALRALQQWLADELLVVT